MKPKKLYTFDEQDNLVLKNENLNNQRLASLSGFNPYKLNTYWKIEAFKELLKVQEKEKLKCNVTRSEEADLRIKIKLMEEAFHEGKLQAQKDEIKFLEKYLWDETLNKCNCKTCNQINKRILKLKQKR